MKLNYHSVSQNKLAREFIEFKFEGRNVSLLSYELQTRKDKKRGIWKTIKQFPKDMSPKDVFSSAKVQETIKGMIQKNILFEGYSTLPEGTTQEQWDLYNQYTKAHKEYFESIKPEREDFETQDQFNKSMSEWSMNESCSRPNKPNHYSANND